MNNDSTIPDSQNFGQRHYPQEDSEVTKKFKGLRSRGKIIPVVMGVLGASVVLGVVVYFFIIPLSTQREVMSPFAKLLDREAEEIMENPITGELPDKKEEAAWITERPLAVMINNHVDARPQSSLIDADIVYEVVAEGGITRFLAFFLTTTPEKIGPVRSAREYYLVLVKETGDAMLMHIGYSPQALVAIQSWPVRSLARGGAGFWRDTSLNVATEHTAYVNGPELREKGNELGWQGIRKTELWKYKDDNTKYTGEASATELSIDFWYKGDYSAVFRYDADNNSYKRFMGYDTNDEPIPHIDRETQNQIEVKNVIVQFAEESPIAGDDKSRLEYQLKGSGEGLVFLDGKVVDITWTKTGREDRTKFYDTNGEELEFNRGKFWVCIVPSRNVSQVTYF